MKAQRPIFIFTAPLHRNTTLPRNYPLLLTPCSKYLHKAFGFRLALSTAHLRCFASTCRSTNERPTVFEMPLLAPASNPSSSVPNSISTHNQTVLNTRTTNSFITSSSVCDGRRCPGNKFPRNFSGH